MPDLSHHRSYALLGVTVVDGTGADPTPDAVVVIEDGRIAAVVGRDDHRPAPGVVELDLSGHWVTPGLIDAHVHLSGGRADVGDQEMGVIAEPMLMRATRSVYEAQALLKRGFTAVRDVSWNGLYLKRLFAEQRIPGPKVIACGPALTRTGGHGDLHQFPLDFVMRSGGVFGIIADGHDDVQRAVRTLLREGADAIKVFASGGGNWPHDRNDDVHYSAAELQAIVEEAHRQTGTLVMCHAENREAIAMAIEAGVDTIEHGEDLDEDLAALMAERGIILVPTLNLIANWYRDFMPVEGTGRATPRPDAFLYRDHYRQFSSADAEAYSRRAIDSYRLALSAGVKIALGSDTVYEPLTTFGEYSALEYLTLIEHGMTVPQAFVAATSTASEALGMSHVIGTIETGKQADLLVLDTDPLSSPRALYDGSNIRLVFCDGILTVRDGQFAW